MKILYIIPTTSGGGIEAVTKQLAKLMNIEGNTCDLLAFSEKDEKGFELFHEIFYISVSGIHVIKSIHALDTFFRTHAYDVVHAHVSSFNGYVALCARKNGVKKIIVHAHLNGGTKTSSVFSTAYNTVVRKISQQLCMKYADYRLACSYSSGDYLFGRKNYVFFPNAVDVQRFVYDSSKRQEIRQKLHVNNEPLILHVGRFSHEKNHKYLLDVFEEIHHIREDCHLVMLGTGELMSEMQQLSQVKGLSAFVHFEGFCSNIAPYYSACDAFLLPSVIEGFPVSLVEAQVCGLPCIASEASPPEIKITDLLQIIPLKEGKNKWATAAVSLLDENNSRETYYDQIKGTSFDKDNLAVSLNKYYCQGDL